MSDQVPAPAETPVARPAWETFELKRLPVLRDEISLYNFQQFAIYKAILQRIFVIALSTGLGKTVCSFVAFFYVRLKFPNTRLIVVTNKSAVLQFRGELDKFFAHDLNALAVHGQMAKPRGGTYADARRDAYARFAKPKDDFGSQIDVLVMNYATFRKDVGDMKFNIPLNRPLKEGEERKILASQPGTIGRAIHELQEQGIKFVFIPDEATAFKNVSADTHTKVARVAATAFRTIALTATLTKGKLEEIYGIYKALGVWLANNKEEFENKYCLVFQHPKMRHIRRITGYKNVGEFVQLIRNISIVLRKIDVAKFLPAYTLKKVNVEHSPEQFKLIADVYAGLIDLTTFGTNDEDLPVEDKGGFDLPEVEAIEVSDPFSSASLAKSTNPEESTMRRVTPFTEQGFIKRALLDPRIVTKKNRSDFKTMSPKTAELMRLLTDEFTGEKIVFYTPSKVYLQMVRDTVKHSSETPVYYKKVLEISGDIDMIGRKEAMTLFTESKDHNLILINDAGLESINLQAASVLIVATMPSSGGNMVQLAGRLSRIGSTHANLLLLYLLTEDSQDQDEYLIINQQMQMMAQIMGEAEKGLIDWPLLKKAEEQRQRGEELSEEEFTKLSSVQLLLHGRKRRAAIYTDHATALLVGETNEPEEMDA